MGWRGAQDRDLRTGGCRVGLGTGMGCRVGLGTGKGLEQGVEWVNTSTGKPQCLLVVEVTWANF